MVPQLEKDIIKNCHPLPVGVKIHTEKDGKIYELVKNDSGSYVWRRVPDNSVKFY